MSDRKLVRVAITGAGDETDLQEMASITADYPFVEWAVLFSFNLTGRRPEFPSLRWLYRFGETDLPCAVHLCGQAAKNAFSDALEQHLDMLHCIVGHYDRLQLNEVPFQPIDYYWDRWLYDHGVSLILQTQNFSDLPAADVQRCLKLNILHDRSLGTGTETQEYDYPTWSGFVGFAGGLSPENVAAKITHIRDEGSGQFDYWVDAQGQLRTDDKLDLVKVRRFLQACEPYVVPTGP
ncbi:MAG: hypothetical protein JSS66_06885 [Armatimonadetes bacterium]|nr:hypothetical protein [Armatimonadota bacterium]